MKAYGFSLRGCTIWFLGIFFVMVMLAPSLNAQSTFPIPGVPGTSSEPAPEAGAPPDTNEATPSQAAQDLANILRDPEAREALIRDLERAATPPAVPPAQAPAAEPETDPAEINIGLTILRGLRENVVDEVQGFFTRMERIPYNTQLALRAFDGNFIGRIISELTVIFLVSYGVFYAVRFAVFPLVRIAARTGREKQWLGKLWRRSLVTLLQVTPIFIASFATISYFVATNPEAEASQMQANYLGAFVVVELIRTAVRFFTSPATPELRLLPMPDRGARSFQRFATISILFLGYAQLVVVPAVSEETSIFVGRALSSLLGSISVLYAIVVVYLKRKDVADWLRQNEGESAFDQAMGAIAQRWHVPILIYLFILFAIVSTHTGNVLLPMLNSTLEFATILFLGFLATSFARSASQRRLKLPGFITSSLPMLEMRVNRLVPAFFGVIRVLIVVVVVLALISSFDFFAPYRIFGSDAGAAFLSALFGVGVIAAIAIAIYLSLSSWVDYQLNPFVGGAPTPRTITLLTLLRNALTIVIVVIALMLSLSQLGLDIGPLLASAGVLGLAISFGAQKMVEDIITGVFIQLENAMNVGDVVDVGGVVGTVEKLTVRSVTLRDLKGVVHMIPFSSAAMISNYMREFSYYVCDMGVAYREDIEEVKIAMFDAFEQLQQDEELSRHILGDLEWFGLNSFDASAIVLRARIKTVPGQQWGIGRAYNANLKVIFDARGIEIPFPHQTLYFGEDRSGNAPPVQVVLHTSEPETSKTTPVTEPTAKPVELDTPPSENDVPDSPTQA
ncbi:mechanosensitive ion channel domain-containing protein [Tropicimonas sp. S265A]|uniref:mechanosensitive ion channel domain-containing protein n=1 Tax=Tropicimonas sp. S265A TaxID=3415134 RepID=UPI003C7DAC7D